jgi:hypothetical protein
MGNIRISEGALAVMHHILEKSGEGCIEVTEGGEKVLLVGGSDNQNTWDLTKVFSTEKEDNRATISAVVTVYRIKIDHLDVLGQQMLQSTAKILVSEKILHSSIREGDFLFVESLKGLNGLDVLNEAAMIDFDYNTVSKYSI